MALTLSHGLGCDGERRVGMGLEELTCLRMASSSQGFSSWPQSRTAPYFPTCCCRDAVAWVSRWLRGYLSLT